MPTPIPTPTPAPKGRGLPFNIAQLLKFRERLLSQFPESGDDNLPDEGSGFRPLTFAQSELGARRALLFQEDLERQRGTERLILEETLFGLAKELLPAGDVDDAIKRFRGKGSEMDRLVNSKLQFQAAIQALADRQAITLREEELDIREEVEEKTLKQARARITVDMVGKDLSRAVLFALASGGK